MNTQTKRQVLVGVAVVVFGLLMNCGGGSIPKPIGKADGSISGIAVKGPVAAGTVKAFKLTDSLERGEELAASTTDALGVFTLSMPTYNGPVLVVVSSGTYTEEAIGLGVKLDGHELTCLVPEYKGGSKLVGLHLTPVSTLASIFAKYHVVKDSKPIVEAYNEALFHLHKHFGDLDWTAVTPADVSAAGVTNLSPEAKAGLVLAGLSWASKTQAEASGVTPGLSLNAATLMSALVQDASDGTLDGKSGGAVLTQGRVKLSGASARVELVQGVTGFINSERNASSLGLADISGFVAGIAGNNDAYLFCEGQVPSASCGTGVVDTVAPVVTWQQPMRDAVGVAGSVSLQVVAEDETEVKTFKFTAPDSLKDVVAKFDSTKRAVLSIVFDVSALPDGPVTIRAEAADSSGNPSAKTLSVVVSNKGPRISVSSPASGATVSGNAVISASAQAQAVGGSITSLTLVEPPAGVGQDSLPSADSFSASWDSKQSPEGALVLTFRAVDSFNTSTETSVTVQVDNVPFGTVSTTVSAGAPVVGATIRLLAIDTATGLPTQARAGVGGPELGSSAPTDANGRAAFTLTGENWDGPVQLVASGASVSFVDPSDGVTPISVPSAFAFTSYLPKYKTGDALTAPMTLWTSVADAAALAYAQGRHPAAPSARSLTDALAVTDPLFAAHVSRPTVWNLRQVAPVSMTSGPTQSLRDVVFAAAPDVSLSTLARALSIRASVTPGSVITGVTLAASLEDDLKADGQFDGKAMGAQLMTAGSPAYSFDANTTRFQQAISLDAFIRGSENATGLTKGDVLAGGVYDAISLDTSLLYPASQTPIPFDNSPPAVSFSATFRKGTDGSDAAPVGAAKVVAGTVTLHASATDPSGVASLTVASSSGALTPSAGKPVGTYEAAFVPGADGVVTFTGTTTDSLGNSGTSTFQLTVDNTPPTIGVSNPSEATFYSASVPVDVSAVDASGVESILQSGLTNLSDTDVSAERFRGTWAVPVGQADGRVAAGFVACDVVGNCATKQSTPTIDRTPPTVAWVAAPPAWSNSLSATIAVASSDASSGVGRVWAQVNGAAPMELSFDGSNWGGVVTWFSAPTTTISVWADDLAVTPNTGSAKSAPFKISSIVRRDFNPPVITNVIAPGYYDERLMALAVDANGDAVFPAVFTFPTNPSRTQLGVPAVVYKSSPRLAATVTAPDLSGVNNNNVAFLRFSAAFDSASESPITEMTFAATSPIGNANGTLMPSAASAVGAVLFELPLTQEYLAFLGQGSTTGIPVTFTIYAKDAASNSGSLASQSVTFNVIAPPLSVRRSMAPTVVDPAATGSSPGNLPRYAGYYFTGKSTTRYDKLYLAGSQWQPDPLVSVAEQIITNPFPVPLRIQLAQPVTLQLATTENWMHRTRFKDCSTDPFTIGNEPPPAGHYCEEIPPTCCGAPVNSRTALPTGGVDRWVDVERSRFAAELKQQI